MRLHLKIGVCVAAALTPLGLQAQAQRRQDVQQQRAGEREVNDTMREGLLTLADMRVRDRPGRHHPFYDSCTTGDGCQSIMPLADTKARLGLPTPPLWPAIKNYPGEWSSSIHALTTLVKTPQGQAPVSIPDSNMFVTSSILYPLYFIKETAQTGPLRDMVDDALSSIRLYKRGAGYSFWRERPAATLGYRVIGPLNIPHRLLDVLGLAGRSGRTPPPNHSVAMRPGWIEAWLDKTINPVGTQSFFNIPSDADDTALAMISYKLFPGEGEDEIPELARSILRHRDLDRTFEDTRDAWKGKNSGAFLTWLKDESVPLGEAFNPATGTIPFGVNNVDCVVNANAVFALGLAGYGDDPAVQQTLTVLNRAIDLEAWPYCGLYYPHKMMFPYTLTRAYRDGGLRHEGMKATLGRIAIRLLSDQRETAARHPSRKGAFSGGSDQTFDLATGLAVSSLLNIGRDIPAELGLGQAYDRAIQEGIRYLVRSKTLTKVRFPEALDGLYRPGQQAALWRPGLFFSASIQSVAGWRSHAYTAAIVVEALAKYLMAWDYGRERLVEIESLSLDQ